jgi:hypothetical protein
VGAVPVSSALRVGRTVHYFTGDPYGACGCWQNFFLVSSALEAEKFAAPATVQTVTCPDFVTVEVRQNAEGTEFYFPAVRNKNFAASATMFLLIFSSVGGGKVRRLAGVQPQSMTAGMA